MRCTPIHAGLLMLAALLAPSPGVAASPFDHQHALYGGVLQRHVRNGLVDYAALQRERAPLDRYAAQLAAVERQVVDGWSRDQRLAFWINAYNALTLRTIIDHYPIRRGSLVGIAFPANSIWQIAGAFKDARHRVAGQRLSLDDIEHRIIRPSFSEPRVHVALVCAARSCPVLRAEPYVAVRLDAQLTEQSRRFAADRNHGVRATSGRRGVEVSSIFKWFGEDFAPLGAGDDTRGVLAFLAAYSDDPELLPRLRDRTTTVRYLDYDWTLNDTAVFAP
ncbi:MAG: DUF547 domain-containing protein [Steroidobacteraceae bacterium]